MIRARLRTALAVALIVLGLPLLLAGAVTAVYIGPDDTVELAREDVTVDGSVVSTAVSVVSVTGPTAHVSARASDGGEVFVGVAHRIHVDSYLDGVAHELVTAVDPRGEVTSQAVPGSVVPDAPPEGLDWWERSASGTGWRSVSYELTDEPVRVVIASPSPSGALEATVSFGAQLDGIFATGLLVGVAGLLLVAGGVLLLWLRRRRRRRELRAAAAEPADDDAADAGDDDAGDDAGDDEPAEKEKVGSTAPLPRRTPPGPRTPPPPAPEPPPKPTARVVAVLGLAGLATGCAQLPQQIDDAARNTLIPAITADRASVFFERYNDALSEAGTGLDPAPLAEVETGALLATSQFAIEEQLTTDTPASEPATASPSIVLSPEVDSYPMWAFVTAETSDGGAPSWYLLVRETAAAPWLANLAVHPPEGTFVTAPLTTGDAAVVADDAVVRRGEEALEALREYGETGEPPDRVDLTHAEGLSRLPDHGLQLDTAPPEFGSSSRSCAVEHPDDIHWLATEYGAVALASISCTQTMTANPGYTVVIEAAGLGTIPGGSEITESQISQNATFILSVDTDGSATVVGQRMRPISMTWSLP